MKRQSDTAAVSMSASVVGNSVTLTFVGKPVDFGSLADGRYRLTILAVQIANLDGIIGDDFVLVGDPAITPKLYRLFG